MSNVRIIAEYSLEGLAETVVGGMSFDDVPEFVKFIDLHCADIDVTKNIIKELLLSLPEEFNDLPETKKKWEDFCKNFIKEFEKMCEEDFV